MAKQEKMRNQETPQTQEAGNGSAAEEGMPDQARGVTNDVLAAYETAKRELNEAVVRLRRELERIDVEQARARARTWVEENPALAVSLAIGAGIVVGRLLHAAVTPAPPPPLTERLRRRGKDWMDQAQDLGGTVAAGALAAGSTLAYRAGKTGSDVVRRARELGDVVAERTAEIAAVSSERAAHQAAQLRDAATDWGETLSRRADEMAATASVQASEWGTSVRRQSKKAGKRLRKRSRRASESFAETASEGLGTLESIANAAKTIAAAVLIKKVTDWTRRIS